MSSTSSILFIDQYGSLGGGQRVLLQMVRAALEAGFSVGVMAPGQGELQKHLRDLSGKIIFYSIPEMKLGQGKKSVLGILKWLKSSIAFQKQKKLLKEYDAVYVNGPRYFLGAHLAAWGNQKPFFYHLHLDHSRGEKKLIRWIVESNKNSHLVINSQWILDQMMKGWVLKSSEGQLHLLENSLSEEFSKLEFDQSRFQIMNPLKVVVIGRLCPEKGQSMVVEVAKNLPEVEFHFFGDTDFADPEYGDNLKATASSNVFFHGKVNNVSNQVKKNGAHISVMPSQWEEPFGLVAIESMAMSCVTLTSGTGELSHISLKTGAFVVKNQSELESQIKDLADMGADELENLALEQYRKALSLYSSEKFEKGFVDIVQKSIS